MRLGLRVSCLFSVVAIFFSSESLGAPSQSEPTSKNYTADLLRVQFINNLNESSAFIYITSCDRTGAVMFLTSAGTWYQPAITGANLVKIDPIVVPGFNANQVSITELLIPAEIESGRVWISRGELQFRVMVSEGGIPFITEPSALDLTDDTSWGFLELTSSKRNGLYANLSFVDFVGLALSMVLVLNSDQIQTVIGTPHNALTSICDALNVQTRVDGIPWGKLCILADDGRPVRVLSPNLYEAANPGATEGYYHQYVTQVWKKYSSHDLYIDTQSWAGLVRCRVDANEEMVCDGDNRAYARPNTADIWGCNTGPFSIREHDNYIHRLIVPRLCAAFSRTTLLMDKGGKQPALSNTSYYLYSPTNHYSRLIHQNEVDGKGYAFPYDDVNPLAENVAGVVAGQNPQVLKIFVGGMS